MVSWELRKDDFERKANQQQLLRPDIYICYPDDSRYF